MPRYSGQEPVGDEGKRLAGDPVVAFSQPAICCSVWLDTTWKVNRWDGAGWVATASQSSFTPLFDVRRVKWTKGTDASCVAVYDLAGYGSTYSGLDTAVTDATATCGQKDILKVTKVYLDGSVSTFTRVDFEG